MAVALIASQVIAGCGGSTDATGTSPYRTGSTRPVARGPVLVSLAGLGDLADSVGHPVYWAGEREGSYELTVDANANIFIRYLKKGVPAGSRHDTSLTIVTYPYANAFEIVRSASRRPGTTVDHTPDGGLVVGANGDQHDVHIAFPRSDIQIEVYDPHPGIALELATSGAIVPIP